MADPKNPFLEMFETFGAQMKLPGADVDQMLDAHRRNIEAFQAAAQISTSSAQAVMDKQRAALEVALSDIAHSVEAASKGDASAMMASQIEMARRSFDTTLAHMTEIGDIMREGNTQAFNVLKDRVIESLDDMKPSEPKKKKK